jgi:polar amino acid transport system substrate-binding protein
MKWTDIRARLVGAVTALALVAAACGGDDSPEQSEASAKGSVSTIKSGELTVGSDIPFPPFEFRKGDKLTGFDVDLTEALARRMGSA